MRRHELSNAQWELISDLMPLSGQRGAGRWRDHRQMANGLKGLQLPTSFGVSAPAADPTCHPDPKRRQHGQGLPPKLRS
jgi:hypothetical protein